jgi:hypothetical protein
MAGNAAAEPRRMDAQWSPAQLDGRNDLARLRRQLMRLISRMTVAASGRGYRHPRVKPRRYRADWPATPWPMTSARISRSSEPTPRRDTARPIIDGVSCARMTDWSHAIQRRAKRRPRRPPTRTYTDLPSHQSISPITSAQPVNWIPSDVHSTR